MLGKKTNDFLGAYIYIYTHFFNYVRGRKTISKSAFTYFQPLPSVCAKIWEYGCEEDRTTWIHIWSLTNSLVDCIVFLSSQSQPAPIFLLSLDFTSRWIKPCQHIQCPIWRVNTWCAMQIAEMISTSKILINKENKRPKSSCTSLRFLSATGLELHLNIKPSGYLALSSNSQFICRGPGRVWVLY